ncbi:MAG: hypothetical protein A2W22_04475 [Candidatus Levybacteria bacterium RBG_16_35_11]|nr:MAG: hypothetical protein A2W22_04475 [Candidatus Levybacteria bacterium RBG_16_35_11]
MIIRDKIFKIHLPKPKYKVIKEIATRWSPRFYSEEKIPQKDINSIFEAARWAPSGRNKQPWYFYHAQKPTEGYKKLFETLDPYNQNWAKTAPLLILACVDLKNQPKYGEYDLGQATFSLVIQARHLGYYSRQMALFDKKKVKQIFKLGKNIEPYIIIAIGEIGDYKKASKQIIDYELDPRPRKSKICEELI